MIFKSQSWKSLRNLNAYTKLLIHSNTTDASTTFTDSSDSGHTVTAAGDAQHDTAQYKFGPTSMLFDGTGDYLSVPDHADFDLGAASFTVDFWVRFASVDTTYFFRQYNNPTNGYYLVYSSETLQFNYFDPAPTVTLVSASWNPSIDTWYHVAVVRSGSTFTLYINGVSIGSDTSDATIPNISEILAIGVALNGWLDEFRLVNGKAMWVTEFVPPKGRYT